MTGFAALKGEGHGARWSWEMRSVNARGLDIRMRLPEGLDDLEQFARKTLSAKLTRGNVTLNLRLQADTEQGSATLDLQQLDQIMEALKTIEDRAESMGLHLMASTASEILAQRGVLDNSEATDTNQKALVADLKAQLEPLALAFTEARAAEGAALHRIMTEQLGRIEVLVTEAEKAASDRQVQVFENLRENLKLVLDNSAGADEARVAQELAMLAVKADVAEEIDRLGAHVEAAGDLLAVDGAVGRKFDFLMQEFNREANTLCSKSGSTDLTRIGLDLKTVIDQMREQVQNVE